jgi:hypothetical protein
MINRSLPVVWVLILVGWVALPPRAFSADKPSPVGKQDAEQLLADAKKALAFTVKSARAGGAELDPTKAEAKPFYESLKNIGLALKKASTALDAKDPGFFAAVNEANDAANDMEVTWELTKSKDADVVAGGKELSGAITALQANYNPLEERKEKGGDLTDDEKKNFDAMKEQMKGLLKEIHDLSAEDTKEVALEDGLKKIRMEARRVEKAPENIKSYADAVNSLSTIQGLIEGYSYFFTGPQKTEWTTVETDSTGLTSDYSYTDETYDWSETSVEIDVYDSYSEEITDEEEASEDSYVEDTSFDMSEEEDSEVAEEGEDMEEDESDDMESEQEDEDDSEEDSDMDEADDDSGGDSDE